MNDIEFKHVESNGIKLRLAMMGDGPLVISVSYTHLTLPTKA